MQPSSVGLANLPRYLTNVLLDPALDPRIAFLLYASIGLILLLVLAVAVILLMGRPEREETLEGSEAAEPGDEFERLAPGEAFEGLDPAAPAEAQPRSATRRPANPRLRRAILGVAVLVLVLAWVIAGYTTSDPAVCKSCHWPSSQHAKAQSAGDPHAKVACVSCHEPGGVFGRYASGLPARLGHFLESQSQDATGAGYGRVTVDACSSCHSSDIAGVDTNKARGLKISHKEPLAASATCIDCHALRSGVVSTHNAGMTPCLRCHDAKQASADCSTCHDEKASAAARVRTASFRDVQIPDVTCGGCHDEKKECDTCHGMRMPHSAEFKAYAHARAGAVDWWYNGGKGCARCHNASRRPCQKCHTKLLGTAHGAGTRWLATGHRQSQASSCDSCHAQYAYSAGRDFCKDLCHTPAAVENSSR